MDNALAVLDQVHQRLATITTVRDAKELRDQAAAISHYAKRARKGLRAQNAAARIKFLCERRGGELLRQVPTVQGQRDTTDGLVATIKTSGLSLQTAYRWMNLARMPEAELVQAAILCDADGEELTTCLVYETIVRQWHEAHGAPTSAQHRPPSSPADVEFMKRDLLEWEIIDLPDLVGLSPEAVAVVVTEVRGTYDDYVEDVARGTVITAEWNPPVTINRQGLRTLTRAVLADLRTGDLQLTSVRHRLRGFFDDAVRRMARRADPKRKSKDPGNTRRILSPSEAYVLRAKRFLAETQGMLQPWGLLGTHVDLPHDILDPLVTRLVTALQALVAADG